MALVELPQEQFEKLDALLAGMEGQDRLSWGSRGERAFSIEMMEDVRNTGKRGSRRAGWDGCAQYGRLPGGRGFVMQDQAGACGCGTGRLRMGDSRKARDVGLEVDREIVSMPAYRPLTRI